jgi:hypothetical protein
MMFGSLKPLKRLVGPPGTGATGLKTGVNDVRSRQIVLARRSLSQRNISSSVSAFFGAAPSASLSK